MIGRSLRHYRIESKLGEGGMGVVYRALDTHLDRPVALKVLTAEAVANPDRKRRFIQEAKAASALNHPGIIHIYDIDAADGIDFIAMEFVPGRTLDQVIGHKGLSLADTLHYGIQIAGALALAHSAGIVHRDLKPPNIMVTGEGLVKVLDFGLAKLTEPGGSNDSEATIDQPPRTEEGVIVGTAAYMSPEQTEGKKVDHRSDVFSYGAVLYEMITGQRAFPGATRMSTLAAILREEPKPVREAAPGVPPELERIVTRCLRKDPNRRTHDLHDVRIALEDLKQEPPLPVAPSPRRPLALLASAAAAIILTALASWWFLRPRPSAGPVLTRLTADSGLSTDPALSPDGKLLAYASDRGGEGNLDLWVQQIPGGEPVRLTRHEADDHEPSFSPDGQKVAFRSERDGGGIYVVSALGGEARLVAPQGRQPRFSPDGSKIVYWVGATGGADSSQMFIIDLTSGTVKRVAPEMATAAFPVWSPDGKLILFSGYTPRSRPVDWWVASVDGRTLLQTGAAAALGGLRLVGPLNPSSWVADGDRVIFSAGLGDSSNLWQIPISTQTGKAEGPPQRLTIGPGPDLLPSAASTARRIAFASRIQDADIWSLPIDHQKGKLLGEFQRVTQEPSADLQPSLTPNGKRMVFTSDRAGNSDVWMKDLETGRETAWTATPAPEAFPLLAPDGTRVAFLRAADTYVLSTAGGIAAKICERCGRPEHWSPDGKRILLVLQGARQIVVLVVATGQKSTLAEHSKQTLYSPRFSPDGRWVAFHSVTGPLTRRIFVIPYRDAAPLPESEWIPITDGSALDRDVCWSPDGGLLYFQSERDGSRCIWAQRLEAATKRPAGEPFPVVHFHHVRRSLTALPNASFVGLSAVPGRLFLSLGELTGNIWMLE